MLSNDTDPEIIELVEKLAKQKEFLFEIKFLVFLYYKPTNSSKEEPAIFGENWIKTHLSEWLHIRRNFEALEYIEEYFVPYLKEALGLRSGDDNANNNALLSFHNVLGKFAQLNTVSKEINIHKEPLIDYLRDNPSMVKFFTEHLRDITQINTLVKEHINWLLEHPQYQRRIQLKRKGIDPDLQRKSDAFFAYKTKDVSTGNEGSPSGSFSDNENSPPGRYSDNQYPGHRKKT